MTAGLRRLAGLVLAALAMASVQPALAGSARIAVFPFALNDTSIEGEMRGIDPAETARLAMITRDVRDKLTARGAEIVDLDGRSEAVALLPDPWNCNGCEVALAREAGATISLTGFVHKVSTLIQSIAIIAHDTESGRMLGNASVSIRGNTDKAWRHGVDYILKHRLLGEKVEAALAEE